MEVLLLARIVFVPSCSLLAFLRQLVLHEFIPKRMLLLVVILKVWREALFDLVFVQVFLEHLASNSHLFMTQSIKTSSLSSRRLKCTFTLSVFYRHAHQGIPLRW
jgi:hypothetical protein